jgi:prepilin-type N-terminal cleavage/methylation domain-containing protein
VKDGKGFTLVETAVALAVFASIGLAVLGALQISARSTMISDEQATALRLARQQIEYVQSQPYDAINDPPLYTQIADIPTGYSIASPTVVRLDPEVDGFLDDDGLQRITIAISRDNRPVLTLTDYKVQT